MKASEDRCRTGTNLVLLSAVTETRLAETVDNGCASLLVVVLFGYIIIFTFEGFSGGVFALTLDYADAAGGFDAGAKDLLVEAGLLL